MRRTFPLLIGGLLLAQVSASLADTNKADGETPAAARKPAAQTKSRQSTPALRDRMPGITPEREAAVMALVKKHHPELADLLVYLKRNQPQQYQRAVRELFRTSERLASIQEKDFDRYDLEVKLWKAQSRSQLLAARYAMSRDDKLLEQLKAVLHEEVELKVALLRRERQRQQQRIKRIEEQIEKTIASRQQAVERQIRQLTRTGAKASRTKTTSQKPPARKPAPPAAAPAQ